MTDKESLPTNTITKSECLDLEAKLEELNQEYHKQNEIQLQEWLKGNSIHNNADHWIGFVDENNELTELQYIGKGECCPDFSCCGCKSWSIEEKKLFIERPDVRDSMLAMTLSEVFSDEKVHITGFNHE